MIFQKPFPISETTLHTAVTQTNYFSFIVVNTAYAKYHVTYVTPNRLTFSGRVFFRRTNFEIVALPECDANSPKNCLTGMLDSWR